MRETYSARDLTAPWIHIEDTVPPESPRFNGSLAVASRFADVGRRRTAGEDTSRKLDTASGRRIGVHSAIARAEKKIKGVRREHGRGSTRQGDAAQART